MQHRSPEIWLALATNVLVTLAYLLVTKLGASPAAGDLLGHFLGIAGYVLMLMTETVYSLRKRSRLARWGRMESWLRFHIWTGLVGPYLALLHTSWKFHGLAGAATLLMVLVVGSGLVGRYIYTAVPRTADGLAETEDQLSGQLTAIETQLQFWLANRPDGVQFLPRHLAALPDPSTNPFSLLLGRTWKEWWARWQWRREAHRLGGPVEAQAREIERLVERRRVLSRQVATLAMTRQMLAVWHSVHIPLAMTLLVVALIHAVAALYYATLLR